MVFDYQNLEEAYCKVKRGKSNNPSQKKYMYYLDENLGLLVYGLTTRTYCPAKLKRKEILYPKRRTARVPGINDKVVQYAICDDYIYPQMERISIKESSACVKGRGTQYGGNLVRSQLHDYYRKYNTKHFYVLKCDIHSYFANINHERLKKLLDRYIEDEDALYWAKVYVDLPDVPDGIPLGLQESHINSNFYLTGLDYLVKYKYRVKYYGRYKDDFYLISNDYDELVWLKNEIEKYLHSIYLEFNPKTAILEDKFDFLGFEYRLTETGKDAVRLSKAKLKQHRRRIRKLLRQLKAGEIEPQTVANYHQGWRTHASWGDCGALIKSEDQWLTNRLAGMNYVMVIKPAKKKPKRKQRNENIIIERRTNVKNITRTNEGTSCNGGYFIR